MMMSAYAHASCMCDICMSRLSSIFRKNAATRCATNARYSPLFSFVNEKTGAVLRSETGPYPKSGGANPSSASRNQNGVFYNRKRLHSYLGYLTPTEYEELEERRT